MKINESAGLIDSARDALAYKISHFLLGSLQYVQLGYDARPKAICLRPVKAKENRPRQSVYKLSKADDASAEIACKHLGRVMPVGRYRFAKKLSTGGMIGGMIFVRDGAAPSSSPDAITHAASAAVLVSTSTEQGTPSQEEPAQAAT